MAVIERIWNKASKLEMIDHDALISRDSFKYVTASKIPLTLSPLKLIHGVPGHCSCLKVVAVRAAIHHIDWLPENGNTAFTHHLVV